MRPDWFTKLVEEEGMMMDDCRDSFTFFLILR